MRNLSNFTSQLSFLVFIGFYLKKLFPFIKVYIFNDELILKIAPAALKNIMFFLKNQTNFQYKIISDICGIDYPEKKNRFEVVYNLLSIHHNSRITLTVSSRELVPLESITSIHKSADWLEREVWDMFGVFFVGHKDLRRILTDYGFKGHPLRKDFPLTGFTELRYNDFMKKINYDSVTLAQDYRIFIFNNNFTY